MLADFLQGIKCVFDGFRLIRTPGIKRHVVIPLMINILLFAVSIYYAYGWAGAGIDAILNWLPAWLDWLSWLLWLVFALLMLVIIFYTFTLLANLFGAPFNGRLAEKLEAQLTRTPPPSAGRVIGTLEALFNAVSSEFVKLGYLLSRSLPLLLLSFVPVLNLAAPALWLLFGAWMLALEYLDYPMGNHNIAFAEQSRRLKTRRALALGFGTGVLIITLIPILNFMAMPVAVAGATQLWVKHLSKQNDRS
jgi:CysZ protein